MIGATLWWYMARSTGLIAAVLLALSLVWGILLSTQLLKPVKRPAWVLDLHRWLGGLTVAFVALHLVGLVADSYVDFTLESILVPFASQWRPAAVTWGVAGLYLLAVVQITSWSPVRARLGRRTWHALHLLSFPLLWVVAMHSGAAGTDVGNPLYTAAMFVLIGITMWVVVFRILAGTGRRKPASVSPAERPRTRV